MGGQDVSREFAQLAGVTVRTLHHYDRLGLLKSGRNEAGYRCYPDADLERLEEIVTLKFIGVPLRRISSLLNRGAQEFRAALRSQRTLLDEKRRLLDTALSGIRVAEAALQRGEQPSSAVLSKIIEVMQMQEDPDWMMKYFGDEAKPTLYARREAWTTELQAQAEEAWTDLFNDIRQALDEDPSSSKAQGFVDRWNALVRAFTGSDQELVSGVKALYADSPNWPSGFRVKMEPFRDERVWDFFRKAVAARNRAAQGPEEFR